MENYYASTLKECALPQERSKLHTTICWVVANKAGDVTVVEKRSGCIGNAALVGCGCRKKSMPLEDVGQYLTKMYAAGAFKKLGLVGHQRAVGHLCHCLPQTMVPLITTEIIEPDE